MLDKELFLLIYTFGVLLFAAIGCWIGRKEFIKK